MRSTFAALALCWFGATAAGQAGKDRADQPVDVLIDQLKDPDAKVRRNAANSLARLGPKAISAAPVLREHLLHDKSGFMRRDAAEALLKIDPRSKESLSTFVSALKDKNEEVCWHVTYCLGQMGVEALPALIEAMGDEDARIQAVNAIGKIGPDAKAAIPTLLRTTLHDRDAKARNAASEALVSVDPKGREALPGLIAAMADADEKVRRSAAATLGLFGTRAEDAVPSLIRGLKDSDSDVRANSASTLGEIGLEAKAAVPGLTEALRDKHAAVCVEAANALGKLGPKAKSAIPDLTEALKSEDRAVRVVSAIALHRVGASPKVVVPALCDVLKGSSYVYVRSGSENRRLQALDALRVLGPEATDAVPALIDALADDEGHVREHAAMTLQSIGSAAKEALPALAVAAKDKYLYVRKAATKAIERIGK